MTALPATEPSSGSEVEPSGPATEVTRTALPHWFSILLVFGLTWVTVAGAFGVVLLYLHWYQPAVVIAVASIAALVAAASPVVPRPKPGIATVHWAAAGALVIAAALSIFAGAFHSEHLLVERDPAVYINLGRTISDTHRLDPQTSAGPFDNRAHFIEDSPSISVVNGRVVPSFFHMLPALLAVAFSLGGDTGMLWLPAILGGLGLLALYALASCAVGPRWALVAPALLALAPLQLWFARDAYSELIVQPLVLGGLWLFLSARRRPLVRTAIAGGFIAATVFARVDALAFVACAFPLAAFEWIRASRRDQSAVRRRALLAFAGGLLGVSAIALFVTRSLSAAYLHFLASEYHELLFACAVSLVAGVGLVAVARRAPEGLGRKLARNNVLFGALVGVVALAFVYLAIFRIQPRSALPALQPGHRVTSELRIAIASWHWRYAVRWFFEYFGVVTIVVAVVGLLLLSRRALRGSGVATSLLCMFVPVTVLYIWRPNVSPDQPWAMRRYLPVTLPAIAIGVAVVFAALWAAATGKRALALRVLAVCLAIAVAVPAAMAARPFAKMRMQDGTLAAVHELCRAAGPDAAILILGYNYIDIEMPATLRAFCNAPSAKPRDQHLDLEALSGEFQDRGRRLLVATASPPMVEGAGVGALLLTHVVIPDLHEPERPTDRRPRTVAPHPLEIWLYEIPASPASAPAG